MSILDTIEGKISIAENDVVSFFSKFYAGVRQEEAALTAELANVLTWVEGHGAETSQLILGIITTVAAAGVGVPVPVLAAAQLLNAGVASVNQAIAASQAGGGGTLAQAVAAGSAAYGAFNHAKSVLAAAPST